MSPCVNLEKRLPMYLLTKFAYFITTQNRLKIEKRAMIICGRFILMAQDLEDAWIMKNKKYKKMLLII